MTRDTSKDTAHVWFDSERGYIFRDTQTPPETRDLPMTNEQKLCLDLQKSFPKDVPDLNAYVIEKSLKRLGLVLVDRETYERWSWENSPDRMGP